MFPRKPRRPMPRENPFMFQRPRQVPKTQPKQNLLDAFRTSEGGFDLNKITGTAQQMHSLYGQVSPMISKFITKIGK
ncbi:YppG family protein [Virgibacillus halodenitrificans]|uniref:YppG family protein n=1 Tax=Virgibacillus halodenitrificans TaxID=1482 RepID=UPI0024C0AA96|nr:YppG family protein [Virgibacillus halodenitrificans]WHX27815.1 YppG family protein [Virgibacillus halodenitrificans]